MKKHFIAMLLASLLISPMAVADEDGYGGLSLGQVTSEEVDTGNLGIVLGGISENGFGYEFFYSFTVIDYDAPSSYGFDTAETDTVSLFGVYQTAGDAYVKAKLGYSYVSITFADNSGASISGSTQDFSFGIGAGLAIGDGAIELTYYKFPDFDDFAGIPVNNDVEMINLAYLWTF